MIKDYEKILEPYWIKGGTYLLPVELVNDLLGELEDLENENKHLLELQKDMDKQYEKLESVIYEIRKYINQLPYDDLKPIEIQVIEYILNKGDKQ